MHHDTATGQCDKEMLEQMTVRTIVEAWNYGKMLEQVRVRRGSGGLAWWNNAGTGRKDKQEERINKHALPFQTVTWWLFEKVVRVCLSFLPWGRNQSFKHFFLFFCLYKFSWNFRSCFKKTYFKSSICYQMNLFAKKRIKYLESDICHSNFYK